MSELDSHVVAATLPTERLPVYDAHHRAKHELLRRYMDVWMAKLGFSYGRVALVDGFATSDLLDVLGWDDCQPEAPVPIEDVVPVLQRYADGFRDLAGDTDDPGQRERAELMVMLITTMVTLIYDDAS
jgi:hypothetical protein